MNLAVAVVFLAVLLCGVILYTRQQDRFEKEREGWSKERRDLMDRIQAPSFDHYKSAEVRVIKAQQPQEEKPKIELV